MKSLSANHESCSRCAHACAWLLACATFPLIWVGGLVTTTDAGMAFRDWMTSDGTFFLFYDWLSSTGDKFVEHGHRLLGALAGFLSIALVIVVWRTESRTWVRKLSWVIFAGVVLQGVLGGMRVLWDERVLAMIHGCTGPLFFSLCAAMVVVTSPWWSASRPLAEKSRAKKVLRLAILCTVLAYLQLVVGAALRHSPHMTGEAAATIFQVSVYFHIFLALMIVGHVLLLAWRCLHNRLQLRGGVILLALVVVQLGLGAGTWLVQYGMPAWATSLFGEMTFVNRANDAVQASLITSHVAVGSLILVTALAVALRIARQLDFRLVPLSTSQFPAVEAVR
ncbi:MAG: COX15/CtaA family protein [Pirellulales bacterium]|nr:COX15/CtaA family protein [Pirellulales bacterium]